MAGEAPLLSFAGRRSRGSFFAYNASFLVLEIALGLALVYATGLGFSNSFNELALNALMVTTIFLFGLITSTLWILSALTSIHRFHDTGHSGWWVLLRLVPGIDLFVWIFLLFMDGTHGDNAFGPDPRQAKAR